MRTDRRRAAKMTGLLMAAAIVLVLSFSTAVRAGGYGPPECRGRDCNPRPTPSLSVSDTTPSLGQTISVTGGGFPKNSKVTILMFSRPTKVGSTTTDSNGRFSVVVTIPSDARLGRHRLVAVSRDGRRVVFADSRIRLVAANR